MRCENSVPNADRAKIKQALRDIKAHGNARHARFVELIEDTEISIRLGTAKAVRGSGSVWITGAFSINWAISRGEISFFDAWQFVRMSIARETIDGGGQKGIEGTIVHEVKHAWDFARMISDFSKGGDEKSLFNPTAYQREYTAHLTSSFYALRRGGEIVREGVELGVLLHAGGRFRLNLAGIRERLKNNYGLTPDAPGKRLSELSFPNIVPRGTGIWGIF